mmetsp:Transcript_165459/g.530912  ORF Transcript_165459/g.530912 Transcript_165459/m.530912 type:complete len:99 (+) Transcript_165459:2016-2312(+)
MDVWGACWHFDCMRNAPQTKIVRSSMEFVKSSMQWCFGLSLCMDTWHGMLALHVCAKCSADQDREEQDAVVLRPLCLRGRMSWDVGTSHVCEMLRRRS